MSINYTKPRQHAAPSAASHRTPVGAVSSARKDLAYALEQYQAADRAITAGKLVAGDRYRKEPVNLRDLYSHRAAAAAQMALHAARVLAEG